MTLQSVQAQHCHGVDPNGDRPLGFISMQPTSVACPALMARHRLPAEYPFAFFVREGGLVSYGIDPAGQLRQAASYVDRILKGAQPADLPVQKPTKFALAINLKTAKALRLTITRDFLLLADEVIE